MAVLLANIQGTLRPRPHQFTRDAHGQPVARPVDEAELRGPFPCSVNEALVGDGSGNWSMRLDPEMWPVEPADELVDADGRVWVIVSAKLVRHAASSLIDFISAVGTLNPPKVP